LFNAIFPFIHLGALLAVLVYAIVLLVQGDAPRFGLIIALLAIYYIFILHPAVKKEIARRKSLKK
jgi:hypothetical protein